MKQHPTGPEGYTRRAWDPHAERSGSMARESRKEDQEDLSKHQPYWPRVVSKHFPNGVLIGRFKAALALGCH